MAEAAPGNITFFHYTSRECLDSILNDGFIRATEIKIKQNKPKRGHFGEGTYGTTMTPDKDREKIAKNNWTCGWCKRVRGGKMDRAIEVSIPKREVKEEGQPKRDILLLPKSNLYLDEYSWKVWTVPKNGTSLPKLLRESAPKGHVSSSRERGIKCASSDSESSDSGY